MPPTPKLTVWQLLVNLAACLTQEIADTEGAKIPCRIMITPGENVTPDYEGDCTADHEECGMAWVRLVNAYPAEGVGEQSITPGNCGKTLGMTINMGIIRCWAPGEARTGPTAAYVEAKTKAEIEDMLLMRKAITCCTESMEDDSYTLAAWLPIGPGGNRIGGHWTLSAVL